MCGIYGWQIQEGGLKKSQLNVIAAVLASENDRRGGDSWGMTFLEGKTVQTQHGLGLISKGPKAYRVAESRQVMAHTRRASTGAVTIENAHPYHIGRIIGAHNGCVYNHTTLNAKYRRTCAVDSMHIFHHIKDKLSLEELRAWGAIEYLKTDEAGVFLGKFEEGELSVRGIGTKVKDSTGLVWSSSGKALEKALSLAGVRSFEYKIDKQTLYKSFKGVLHSEGILPVSTSATLSQEERRMSEATGTFRGGEGAPTKVLIKKAATKDPFIYRDKVAKEQVCGLCNDETFLYSPWKVDGIPICKGCNEKLTDGEGA